MKKWSEVKCEKSNIEKSLVNQKLVLENCLDKIRFCAMTNEEFNTCVEDSFLSKDEMFDVFRNIASNGAHKSKFSSQKRLNKAYEQTTPNSNVPSSGISIGHNSAFGFVTTPNNSVPSVGLASTTNNIFASPRGFSFTPPPNKSASRYKVWTGKR